MVEEAKYASSATSVELGPRRSTMKHNRLVYSVEEAARIFRISRSHAYSLIEKGDIPYIKLGKCKRITVEGIAQILKGEITPTGKNHNYRNENNGKR